MIATLNGSLHIDVYIVYDKYNIGENVSFLNYPSLINPSETNNILSC